MPAESGGYEAIKIISAFEARTARIMVEKSFVVGG